MPAAFPVAIECVLLVVYSDDDEEPTSKEGSAPDNLNGSNGNGSNGNGSNGNNNSGNNHGSNNGQGNGTSGNGASRWVKACSQYQQCKS